MLWWCWLLRVSAPAGWLCCLKFEIIGQIWILLFHVSQPVDLCWCFSAAFSKAPMFECLLRLPGCLCNKPGCSSTTQTTNYCQIWLTHWWVLELPGQMHCSQAVGCSLWWGSTCLMLSIIMLTSTCLHFSWLVVLLELWNHLSNLEMWCMCKLWRCESHVCLCVPGCWI